MKWLASCLLISTVYGGVNLDPYQCPPCPVTMVCIPCIPGMMISPSYAPPNSEYGNPAQTVPYPQPVVYDVAPPHVPDVSFARGRRVVLPPSTDRCHDYLCKALLRSRRPYSHQGNHNPRLPLVEQYEVRKRKVTRRCRLIHECETSEIVNYRN